MKTGRLNHDTFQYPEGHSSNCYVDWVSLADAYLLSFQYGYVAYPLGLKKKVSLADAYLLSFQYPEGHSSNCYPHHHRPQTDNSD